MLNTFENSDRFHRRQEERQRALHGLFSPIDEHDTAETTRLTLDGIIKEEEPSITLPAPLAKKLSWKKIFCTCLVSTLVVLSIAGLSLFSKMVNGHLAAPEVEGSAVPSGLENIRYKRLFSLVIDWGLTPRAHLEDPSSAAYMALRWLVNEDVKTENPEELRTRFALASVYFSTQQTKDGLLGITWSKSTRWLSSYPVCLWYGVECQDDMVGSWSRVTTLNLSGNGLVNHLPDEIGLIGSGIRKVDVSNNSIGGTLPSSLSLLQNLKDLFVGDCLLTGEIPAEITRLLKLQALDLHNNNLSSTIPDLSHLSSLGVLYLDSNILTGSIPSLPRALVDLRLRDNDITGTIPNSIGNLLLLQICYLDTLSLSGTLPSSIGNLQLLHELHIHNAGLYGSIPPQLTSLQLLRRLYADGNQMTGSIPTELGFMTHLEQLYLFNNRLSGSIPLSIGLLSNLKDFLAYGNQLDGSLPEQLGILSHLEAIELNNNQLSGTIPQNLRALTHLTRLHLHSNNLSGSMPLKVCRLTSYLLQDLTADCNGEFPKVECTCCLKCY